MACLMNGAGLVAVVSGDAMPQRAVRTTDRISPRAIGRLIGYRRVVAELVSRGHEFVFSHDIADRSGASPAQVRRDLMAIGYSGMPKRGYEVVSLMEGLDKYLGNSVGHRAVLVGVGNLGMALLAYFTRGRSGVSIEAAFDADEGKVGKSCGGCRCHPAARMQQVIRKLGVRIGIIAVPADAAQNVAEMLVEAGITGVLNFAPVSLSLPERVFVEDLDVGMSLEKIAFFAGRR